MLRHRLHRQAVGKKRMLGRLDSRYQTQCHIEYGQELDQRLPGLEDEMLVTDTHGGANEEAGRRGIRV